jgi:hypothetical protein
MEDGAPLPRSAGRRHVGFSRRRSDLTYVLWDGTSWDTPSEQETNTAETKNQPFLFLWSQQRPRRVMIIE